MIGGRYNFSAVFRALREPGRLLGEARRLGMYANATLRTGAEPFDVMGADWDILVILDGCRLDLFKSESELDGETTAINTGASQSTEFMNQQFHGESHHDTVYVSANPYTSNLPNSVFHDIKNVYTTHWDDEVGTVQPESVADVAVATASEYPNKRLIIHFMQPHYPFIGESGQRFDSGDIERGTGGDVWTLLQNRRCPVDKETVWEAYIENYRLTETSVCRLHSEIGGKMVVTADHGNLVGERLSPIPVRGYGHPRGVPHPVLREVPWHTMPVTERRTIESAPPKEIDDIDEEEIEARLEAFGYR